MKSRLASLQEWVTVALFGESMEAFGAAPPAPSSSSLPSSLASSAAPAVTGLADHGSAPADGEKWSVRGLPVHRVLGPAEY